MDLILKPITRRWNTLQMSYTKIDLAFEFGTYNGGMNLTLNGEPVTTNQVHLDLELPAVLVFTLSGKDYNHDTEVNQEGVITNDKYVKLLGISIGGIPLEEVNLLKILDYQTDQNTTIAHSTYWGFNGTVTIDIKQQNFIKYLLLLNNKFNLI